MARTTSRGPKPFDRRYASTRFLRVHLADWPAVKRGYKTEFRSGAGHATQVQNVPCPSIVVGYAIRPDDYDYRLLVLEESWLEPLGAISERSLQAEGYRSLAEFRRAWMARERRRFTPTRSVVVYRVRPAEQEDIDRAALDTFTHLYGPFLEPE